MNTQKIDLVNIGLMLISCILAFVIPFELFLFSYAVLGPLHYLTEISWLHKRNYFSQGKYDFIYLCILAILITFISFFAKNIFGSSWGHTLMQLLPAFILMAFVAALALAFIKEKHNRYIALIIISVGSLLLFKVEFYKVFVSIFLPTMVHVYLFTGAFILLGALRNKSLLGFLSLFVFIVCTLSFFVYVPKLPNYDLSDGIKIRYVDMLQLNYEMINFLHLDKLNGLFYKDGYARDAVLSIFHSDAGYIVMRFIAFAYTYHYLNWFSKTSVIKWHQVPKLQLGVVLVLWAISVGLYFYDYGLGLRCLYLLSLLHVFLEFPLNYHTFIGISKEMKTFRLSAIKK